MYTRIFRTLERVTRAHTKILLDRGFTRTPRYKNSDKYIYVSPCGQRKFYRAVDAYNYFLLEMM